MIRPTVIVTIGLVVGAASEARAQRQSLGPVSQKPSLEASLSISGLVNEKTIQVSGGGSCGHAPDASFNGASASLWTVKYAGSDDGAVKRLNLTLWRPKDGGPDQLSFEIKAKSGDHKIQTGPKGKHKGEGAVTIIPSGPGGRLELSGKDGKGKPIQISIDCPTFGELEAAGD